MNIYQENEISEKNGKCENILQNLNFEFASSQVMQTYENGLDENKTKTIKNCSIFFLYTFTISRSIVLLKLIGEHLSVTIVY